MPEVTVTCPTCGQNIIIDSSASGTQTVCPNCQSALIIPPATESVPPMPPVPARQKTSGLAIASLVCSLFVCLGCIPGIICGHMAKRRIRRDPSLKGLGLANAGLVIGYLSLLVCGGSLAVSLYRVVSGARAALRDFQPTIAIQPGTNSTGEAQPAGGSVEPLQVAEQAGTNASAGTGSTGGQDLKAGSAAWTLELSQVSFPDQPVAGMFRGANFTGENCRYRGGTLTITGAAGASYVLHLGLKRADPLGGTSFAVLPSDTAPACKVAMSWEEDGSPTTQRIPKGYALRLQFGKAEQGKIPGKIYLCLPDAQKSFLAGSFTVAARR